MYKFFIANKKIYRASLEKKNGNHFNLKEERLEGNHWSKPVRIELYGKDLTLEQAMKRVYGYPFYYSSLKEAKRGVSYVC